MITLLCGFDCTKCGFQYRDRFTSDAKPSTSDPNGPYDVENTRKMGKDAKPHRETRDAKADEHALQCGRDAIKIIGVHSPVAA